MLRRRGFRLGADSVRFFKFLAHHVAQESTMLRFAPLGARFDGGKSSVLLVGELHELVERLSNRELIGLREQVREVSEAHRFRVACNERRSRERAFRPLDLLIEPVSA